MENRIEINGKQVIDFTPDNAREIALVDLKVLRRLTEQFKTSSFEKIRHSLREQIMMTDNLETLVEACEDFAAFHRSVNLVQSYMAGEITSNMESCNESGVRVVGRIDLDDLDTCARDHTEY
jgi:hypothetical protein